MFRLWKSNSSSSTHAIKKGVYTFIVLLYTFSIFQDYFAPFVNLSAECNRKILLSDRTVEGFFHSSASFSLIT